MKDLRLKNKDSDVYAILDNDELDVIIGWRCFVIVDGKQKVMKDDVYINVTNISKLIDWLLEVQKFIDEKEINI